MLLIYLNILGKFHYYRFYFVSIKHIYQDLHEILFDKLYKKAEDSLEGKRVKVPDEETDVICDKCGRKMVVTMVRIFIIWFCRISISD